MRVIVPALGTLDGVVLGGDRSALRAVLTDPRLAGVRDAAQERVIDVPEPRLDVLRAAPERYLATVIRPTSPP